MTGLGVSHISRAGVITVAIALLAGCQEPDPWGRTFVEVEFDTVFVAGGVPADTVFLRPIAVKAWRHGLVVVDEREPRVTALDEEGELRWIYHRPGRGPGEIAGRVDVTTMQDGRVVALGREAQKLLELSPRGGFLREERHPRLVGYPGNIERVAPDRFLIMNQRGDGVVWSRGEGDVERIQLEYPQHTPAMAQRLVSVGSDGAGTWVAAMRFGPSWWISEDGAGPTRHRFRHEAGFRSFEHRPDGGFAQFVGDRWPYGAVSISVEDGEVWVLTGGGINVDGENDTIDVFSTEGDYLHSFRLPTAGWSFVRSGKRLYVLAGSDPAPSVLALDIRF